VDTDTIANVILFLSARTEIAAAEWLPALTKLLNHQKPDGGFSTVIDRDAWLARFPAEIRDIPGWTASHPCVSAVVALMLASLNLDERGLLRDREPLDRVADYLRACQQPEGCWHAYWWTGPYYTTCRAVQALCAAGAGADPAVRKACAWLAAQQQPDGSWRTRRARGSALDNAGDEAFQTALAIQTLAVQTLAALPNGGDTQRAVERGVCWLVTHQMSNGGWPTAPIMLLPSPEILCSWERRNWRESNLGLNVVVPDWRGCFTTATALQALHVANIL
jgi:squalene cyclase